MYEYIHRDILFNVGLSTAGEESLVLYGAQTRVLKELRMRQNCRVDETVSCRPTEFLTQHYRG